MYQNIIGEFKTEYEMRNTFVKTRDYNLKDDIFKIYWKDFLEYADNSNLTIRNVVLSEIDRLLKCKTDELGYSLYKCPHCDNELMVHNTCKCRTCPSCGIKYAKQRTQNIMNHLYNCPHRHITFTIPSTLWNLFRENRKLLNLLFEAVNSTLSRFFYKIKKNENFKGGFILTLHTFGRSNNWNVHIHALVAEMAIGDNTAYRKVNFFPFDLLRKSFQTALLSLLEKHIGKKKFRSIKNQIYSQHDNGFYVNAPSKKGSSSKKIIEYVLRYCGRPAFASYRILDISNNQVTFFYQRHKDDFFVVEKISIFEFIKRIIIHIPDKQFKTIRYYGFYNKKHKFHDKIKTMIDSIKVPFYHSLNKFRMLMIKSFNIDPFICDKCGSIMEFHKLIC